METLTNHLIDPQLFRRVLGHYPTGVCVITALDPETGPIGMTVGTFTSVSLDPALIAFLPTKESGTYQRIRKIGTFCVNVLASNQDDLCRLFARRGADKFDEVAWNPAPSGAPVIDDAIAWIDCQLFAVHEAGDHDIVIGEVTGLGTVDDSMPPLLFFQGGYGRFSTLSLMADADDILSAHLRLADRARPYIESLAQRYGVDCHASALIGDEVIQLAYAGAGGADLGFSRVGLRLPVIPPMGSLFVAWAGPEAASEWLSRSGRDVDPIVRRSFEAHLGQIRAQGWAATPNDERLHAMESIIGSMAANGSLPVRRRELQELLGAVASDFATPADSSAESPVHSISAPVFDDNGAVVLALTVNDGRRRNGDARFDYQAALFDAAARVTQEIGGRSPV
ncbi:flavin reductase [Arthrobacter sp. B2a2-09]|uniref:flavin reductase n=1 Tax=Arthrobacter sp. B2a2-09 TaxID=2952822 RepID=UPI0022CD37CD|nr:flavin reductase [Arthrobacter sp. B2a2-09]MCZ9880232.1 flavin reductase [Arthrobacter sp. B2a2-09]